MIEEFQSIVKTFKEGGCSAKDALTFINHNFEFLKTENQEIAEKIYFIYNNKKLYGALLVDENDYSWSIYGDDRGFSSLQKVDDEGFIKKGDYIVEMMIHFADTEKVKQAFPSVSNMSIEKKVKTLKRIGLNSKGYHFK